MSKLARNAALMLTLAAAGIAAWYLARRHAPSPPPVPAQVAVQAPEDPFAATLLEIVTAYRKIIVLLNDESSMDDRERATASTIGRLIFYENQRRLADLTSRLTAELEGAAASGFSSSPTTVERFLLLLEGHPEFHDADKLVFRELVEDLIASLQDAAKGAPAGRLLAARLEDDRKALLEIQSLYNRELERILGRFERRGMPVRREAWERYVAYLKTKLNRAAIFKEYESAAREVSDVRGDSKEDGKLQVFGTTLPPNTLVLTFDDGPHPRYTDRILEILKKYGVKSVFFSVGRNLGMIQEDKSVKQTRAAAASCRAAQAGFTLANHSFSHPQFPKLSDKEIATEIESTNRLLKQVARASTNLFRPPYGMRDRKVLAAMEGFKMKAVLWNIDSQDWADPVPKSIAARVLQAVDGERRGILLFHDIHERTVEALPDILEALQKGGYRFLSWNGKDFAEDPTALPLVRAQPDQPPPPLYRESWAVVIGIDEYKAWPRLRYAVRDAEGIKELLVRRYRFKPDCIITLLNADATRANILSALGDTLAAQEKIERNDRIFVFFAGHGVTRKLPSGRDLGYIVPVDADVRNYQGQSISMTNFQDISEAIPAKHILYVMDSCYSGLALTRGAATYAPDNFLREISRRAARQMLTAGGADEQVADNGPSGHSVFTWTLMQGLEGRADLNADGFITASELASYVGPIVSSLSRQTPAFGNLVGSEGGEFVFELKHENEFLSDVSIQLDEEDIRLNSQLDRIRSEIAAKRERNLALRRQLAAARSDLTKLDAPARPTPSTLSAPESARAHNDRGMAYFKERKYEEALKQFLAAARLEPSDVLVTNNAGYMFYKLERFREAAEWFEKSIALDPRRAVAHANLGDTYLKLDRKEDARKAFEKYLELAPNAKSAPAVRSKLAELIPQ